MSSVEASPLTEQSAPFHATLYDHCTVVACDKAQGIAFVSSEIDGSFRLSGHPAPSLTRCAAIHVPRHLRAVLAHAHLRHLSGVKRGPGTTLADERAVCADPTVNPDKSESSTRNLLCAVGGQTGNRWRKWHLKRALPDCTALSDPLTVLSETDLEYTAAPRDQFQTTFPKAVAGHPMPGDISRFRGILAACSFLKRNLIGQLLAYIYFKISFFQLSRKSWFRVDRLSFSKQKTQPIISFERVKKSAMGFVVLPRKPRDLMCVRG